MDILIPNALNALRFYIEKCAYNTIDKSSTSHHYLSDDEKNAPNSQNLAGGRTTT
jgi:hypothetical protein